MGIDEKKTICVDDNENDIMLGKMSGVSIAVANAVDDVKAVADFITVDNNSNTIAAVIENIENGTIAL